MLSMYRVLRANAQWVDVRGNVNSMEMLEIRQQMNFELTNKHLDVV